MTTVSFNPPEAIRNLVTPLATPRSVRPGFFNTSGHTTVGQIGFFKDILHPDVKGHTTVSQTRFFFNASGHTTVYQTIFFVDILDLDVNDHTTVSQTRSMVWSLTSYVEKVTEKKEKKLVCETVVRPLTLKKADP